MEIVEKTNLVEVSTLRKGTVFRYKKEYYMVSDGYRGDMNLKNRLYINLRTGHGDVFMNVKVESIENIKMVIGGKE